MLGAIAGDIIGSPYEFKKIPSPNFDLFTKESKFTDDTVLSIAVADAIMNNKNMVTTFHEYFDKYENNGFGGYFIKWCKEKNTKPYGSWANGSAMRVSSVGWIYETLPRVEEEAERSAVVTHNHPEAVKGAQAIAGSIFLARITKDKNIIANYIFDKYYTNIKVLHEIRNDYLSLEHKKEACSCKFSVPAALSAFLHSKNFEDCIRKAVSLGGDTDTVACMAGSIAEAYYGIPKEFIDEISSKLDGFLSKKLLEFTVRYPHLRLTGL